MNLTGITFEEPITGGGSSDASGIAYSNTESSLLAENVQDAIDELDARIDVSEASVEDIEAITGVIDPSGATEGQALVFNGTSFVPQTVSTGGGGYNDNFVYFL